MADKIAKRKQDLVDKLAKKFGSGNIHFYGKLGDVEVPRMSSSSAAIDYALGGGFRVGAVHEIFGAPSSGKTSLCLSILAQAQKDYPDKVCIFLDAEMSVTPDRFDALGVNTEELIFITPESAEAGIQTVLEAIESGIVSCVFIDSIAALTPQVELENDMGDRTVGTRARLLTQFMVKVTPLIARHNTTLFLVNQERDVIGGGPYGPTKTTPGGNAVKFHASTRIRASRTAWIGDSKSPQGIKQKIKVVKNKTAPPYREAEVSFLFDSGYDQLSDLLDTAKEVGVVFLKGAWYFLDDGSDDGIRLGQGAEKARESLLENDGALFKKLKELLNNAS